MTSRESELDQITRRLKGAQAVRDACEAARQFAAAQWLADDELARLCIVVEEWVANLYEHGGLTMQDEIILALACEPEGIRVTVTDPGPPFDPRTLPTQVERLDRGGGVGIGIMRAWSEFVSYEVSDAGNRFELLLPIQWEG